MKWFSFLILIVFQSYEGERNVHKWCDKILVNHREMSDRENDKSNKERHVAEKGEQLERWVETYL